MLLSSARLTCVGICVIAVRVAAAGLPPPDVVTSALHKSVPTIRQAPPARDWRHFFAGHFCDGVEIAEPPIPTLSGHDIYLFPDASYIYIEWTDILPETIYDKGSWEYDGRYLHLRSDHSVPQKDMRRDAAFLPVTARIGGRERLLIIGVPRRYTYYRKHVRGADEFMFLICADVRKAAIADGVVAATKQRLMRNSWRPDFFSN